MKEGFVHRLRATLVLVSICAASAPASAQPEPVPSPSQTEAPSKEDSKAVKPERRFLDEVTVSATLNPASVRETPGTVSVIDFETIDRRMIETVADLVKFEPGVYVESNLNRVGLNGFNIRGIGGNRVMTQTDGVETSEQFDFGPFNVHQFDLDLDALRSAEIVRSSNSSLYGSDALGGVVSFFTKDPADYLQGRHGHVGGKILYDGRSRTAGANFVLAGGKERLQGSLFGGHSYGHEPDNFGAVRSEDANRTALNPQDRRSTQALGKAAFRPNDVHFIKLTGEVSDSDIDVQAFSARATTISGPVRTTVAEITSEDRMRRLRASYDHTVLQRAGVDQWTWSAYAQSATTDQVVDELRVTTGAGPATTVKRAGFLDYEQRSYGGSLQGRKALGPANRLWMITFGATHKQHDFDMLRDRTDRDAASGALIPQSSLILPSKYFPKSRVAETGAYFQTEARLGRLTFVPAIRYDRFAMDADERDAIYLATQSPVPADFSEDAVSTKVGLSLNVSQPLTVYASYARGFRAPPYSAINSGFTNLASGYTSLSNPDLRAETSDNFEAGVRLASNRVALSVTGFSNDFRNFIDQIQRGLNPTTRLIEFQYQNVRAVTIEGVELRGEARVSDSFRLRASYAVIRGHDVSSGAKTALGSIAPDQGVASLEYVSRDAGHGGEVSIRSVRAQRPEVGGTGMFSPAAFAIFDLTGWARLSQKLRVRAGVLNATNAKSFEWANVRGRGATDATIDRYSSPGISAIASLSVGW